MAKWQKCIYPFLPILPIFAILAGGFHVVREVAWQWMHGDISRNHVAGMTPCTHLYAWANDQGVFGVMSRRLMWMNCGMSVVWRHDSGNIVKILAYCLEWQKWQKMAKMAKCSATYGIYPFYPFSPILPILPIFAILPSAAFDGRRVAIRGWGLRCEVGEVRCDSRGEVFPKNPANRGCHVGYVCRIRCT